MSDKPVGPPNIEIGEPQWVGVALAIAAIVALMVAFGVAIAFRPDSGGARITPCDSAHSVPQGSP